MDKLDLIAYQIPPLKNWQTFENLCCDLFRRIWGDNNTKKHGRQGQPQSGVDIWGRPNKGNEWSGVQCKGKDNYEDKTVTKGEINTELKKAKTFNPPLSEYIIATTGKKDIEVEQHCRELTEQRKRKGSFIVDVWSWEDIVGYLGDNLDVARKYYPFLGQDTDLSGEVRELTETIRAMIDEPSSIRGLKKAVDVVEYPEVLTTMVSEGLSKEFQAELNHSKELLKEHYPQSALDYLLALRDRSWDQADDNTKYRIMEQIGSAKMALGFIDEAAEFIIESLQYNKNDCNALSNTALAYSLVKNKESANDTIQRALEIDPKSKRANEVLVHILRESGATPEEILRVLPKEVRNESEVLSALALTQREHGNLDEAIAWQLEAVKNDENKNPILLGVLGTMYLELVFNDPSILYGMQISVDNKKNLMKSTQYLRDAWSLLASTELAKSFLHFITNKCVAEKLANNIDIAYDDILTAESITPDDKRIKKLKALLLIDRHTFEEAEVLLRGMVGDEQYPEIGHILGDLLFQQEKYYEAVTTVNQALTFYQSIGNDDLYIEGSLLMAQILISNDQATDAEGIADSLVLNHHQEVRSHICAFRVHKALNDSADATSFLSDAIAAVQDNTPRRDIVMLAGELYDAGRYEEAANFYKIVADTSVNSFVTHRLIYSLYKIDALEDTLSVCGELRKNGQADDTTIKIECSIYESAGNLKLAREICESHVDNQSADPELLLFLARVCYRQGDYQRVDAIIGENYDLAELDLESGILLSQLLAMRGNDLQALKNLYELRRRHYDRPEIHSAYLAQMFPSGKYDKTLFESEKVDEDTAVGVKTSNGKTQWYIIEDREDSEFAKGEISSSHKLSKLLMGKPQGDTIVLSENQYSKLTGTIEEIKSKYVHAFHVSMGLIGTVFPEMPGITPVSIERSEEGKTPEAIQKILDELKEREERGKEIDEYYDKGLITLGGMASLAGKTTDDAWLRRIASPELGLRFSSNHRGDFEEAEGLLQGLDSLVLDVVAIKTIFLIGLQDFIPSAYGRLALPQSVRDYFQQILEQRTRLESEGFMVLGVHEGKAVRQEISAEQVQESIDHYRSVVKWIDEHCEIVPVEQVLKIDRKEKEKFDQFFGVETYDAVLTSQEGEGLLFSDDLNLRKVVKGLFSVESVWTEPILRDCLRREVIDNTLYKKAIVDLIKYRYRIVNINAELILYAAEQAGYLPVSPLEETLEMLNGKYCSFEPAANVATNFIVLLYSSPITDVLRRGIIMHLLKTVIGSRNFEERSRIVNLIVDKLKVRLRNMPGAVADVLDIVRVFARHVIM